MNKQAVAFNPVEFLTDKRSYQSYLDGAVETGDMAFILDALGDLAKAYGLKTLAKETGLSTESLCTLSENGDPTLKTLSAVCSALEVKLTIGQIPNE